MIVVDASALLEVLLRGPRAARIEAVLFAADEPIAAPHLIDLEVAQVLRRLASRGALTPRRAEQAMEDLAAMPITRYEHAALLPRIWALREILTACDAAYLALAEALAATLLTCDAALGAAPGHGVEVTVVD